MTIAAGLPAGKSKQATTKVTIPNWMVEGLVGKYYYGAAVVNSQKASSKQVSIVRYKDNGDGTVTDFKTGLQWQKSNDSTKRNWSAALSYCDDL